MSFCVIKVWDIAGRDPTVPFPYEGQWLETYDPDAFDGRGDCTFTDKINHAKRFASKAEAMACWNQQSIVRPRRPDGQPNKPLSAFTVEIEQVL